MMTITDKEYDSMLDEIERLKAEVAHYIDMASQADVACIQNNKLLTSAADALENQFEHMEALEYKECYALVEELREAAK
jgi:hypothetical protein